jgi:hypothetical protein
MAVGAFGNDGRAGGGGGGTKMSACRMSWSTGSSNPKTNETTMAPQMAADCIAREAASVHAVVRPLGGSTKVWLNTLTLNTRPGVCGGGKRLSSF